MLNMPKHFPLFPFHSKASQQLFNICSYHLVASSDMQNVGSSDYRYRYTWKSLTLTRLDASSCIALSCTSENGLNRWNWLSHKCICKHFLVHSVILQWGSFKLCVWLKAQSVCYKLILDLWPLTLYGRTTAEPPLMPTMGTDVWVEMKSKICATASEPTLSSNTTPWTRLVERVSQMRVSSVLGLVLLTNTVIGFTSRGRSMKFSLLNRPLISAWYAEPLNTTATFTEGVGIPNGRPEQQGTVQESSSSSGGHHGESLKQPRRTPISVTYCLEEGTKPREGSIEKIDILNRKTSSCPEMLL